MENHIISRKRDSGSDKDIKPSKRARMAVNMDNNEDSKLTSDLQDEPGGNKLNNQENLDYGYRKEGDLYICTICMYSVPHRGHMNRHIKWHTNHRPHVCEVCGMYFSRKHSLLTHCRIHTGEKPYTCDICNKAFTRSDVLHRHKLTIHHQ